MSVIHFIIEDQNEQVVCRVESPPGTQIGESSTISLSSEEFEDLDNQRWFIATEICHTHWQNLRDPCEKIGRRLFKTLMYPAHVESLYRNELEKVKTARQAGNYSATLNLWISCKQNKYQALPWELMFDPEGDAFLSMSEHICIFRSPGNSQYDLYQKTVFISDWRPPLRLLVMIATPQLISWSDSNHREFVHRIEVHEYIKLFEQIRKDCGEELVSCKHLVGIDATYENLEKELRGQYDVFYFVGHSAAYEGETVLVLEDGTPNRIGRPLNMIVLQDWLQTSSVRLVILSSCNSFAAATAFSRIGHLEGVIGMQMDMPMLTAPSFDKAVINALITWCPTHEYMIQGRKQVKKILGDTELRNDDSQWRVTGRPHWAIPIIYTPSPEWQHGFCTISSGEFEIGIKDGDLHFLSQQFGYSNGLPDYLREYLLKFPHRKTEISNLQISRWPVTNHQYRFFLENSPSDIEPPPGFEKQADRYTLNGLKPSAPVVGVTWEGANRYCRWMGGRLPTADEWEVAARCSKDETRLFPWGNEFDPRLCSTVDNKTKRPESVFNRKNGANFHNIEDLCGNVFEWTASPFDVTTDKSLSYWRMVVGGSWKSPPILTLPAIRCPRDPSVRYRDVGFRCVKTMM